MIEVTGQIRIDHLPMPRSQQCPNVLDRVQRTAFLPVGILFRLQVGFENRFENQHGSRHHDTILDCRNS